MFLAGAMDQFIRVVLEEADRLAANRDPKSKSYNSNEHGNHLDVVKLVISFLSLRIRTESNFSLVVFNFD